MEVRTARKRWPIATGALLLAIAIPGVGAAAMREVPDEKAPTESPGGDPGSVSPIDGAQRIAGTDVSIPAPDPTIGSQVVDLAIPLRDTEATVRGVAFYRPGPIRGSVVGGVSVVYDDASPLALETDGGQGEVDAIARTVDGARTPERREVAGRRVLAWPRAEVVPAGGIEQKDRQVGRYVVLLEGALVMVTFDDVPVLDAERYLETLVGAL